MGFDKKQFATDVKTKRMVVENKSLRGLAEEIDVHYGMLHKIEREETTPDVGDFAKVCKWLGEEPAKYLK